MASNEPASLLSRIRRMAADVGGISDAQLLARFVGHRDEAAFELLLWRHARLVYGVCLRVLHDPHDAEDAFQATFLTLARHAGRIARREAIAGWLHRVALRVALTARGRRARRDARERLVGSAEDVPVTPAVEGAVENQELRCLLDQEIARLPERFRVPLVLCYLEGKSVDEAARLLACPRGTVASRLARARERLRARLVRRGLAVVAAMLTVSPADASAPFTLIPILTVAALRYAGGGSGSAAALAPRVTALSEEVLRTMFTRKLRTGLVVLVVLLGTALAGGRWLPGFRANAEPDAEPAGAQGDRPVEKVKAKVPRVVTVARPTRREAAPYQDYVGLLEAGRAVEVRPAASGFVQKVCFKAGAEVRKGDVLFELDPRAAQATLDRGLAGLILAETKLKFGAADLDRVRRQVEKQAAPQAELDAATERVATADAAVKTAKLDVEHARLELEAMNVFAPMSGRAGRPLVEPGTLVFRGTDRATLLTTITALDPIRVAFELDESSFLRYQRLQREGKVNGPSVPLRMASAGDDHFSREGIVEWVSDHANPETGTVRVEAQFPNPGQQLLPGMSARVRLPFGKPRAVLEVPEAAILSDQGNKYVVVVNDRQETEVRPVTVGWADGDLRVVEKGLGAEDRVVVGGLKDLRTGDPVEPRKAEPSPRPKGGQDHGK